MLAFNWTKMVLINTVFDNCYRRGGSLLQSAVLLVMSNAGFGGAGTIL